MKNKSPKIIYTSFVIPPFSAMTIPPIGIFVRPEQKNNIKLLNHEKIHWQQYKRMGILLFYFRYLMQILIIGYDNAPMEIEAGRLTTMKQKRMKI